MKLEFGGQVTPAEYAEGFWYVESVTHELFSETLLTHLKLTRDGNIDESTLTVVDQPTNGSVTVNTTTGQIT